MVGLGYLVGHLMGWTPWESLLTGAILSISGIVIIAKAFEETRWIPEFGSWCSAWCFAKT
jgi:hypothetical protein